jgi:hypothetical protein
LPGLTDLAHFTKKGGRPARNRQGVGLGVEYPRVYGFTLVCPVIQFTVI